MSVARVQGLRARTKNIIVDELKTVNRSMKALPSGADKTPYYDAIDKLLSELTDLSERRITALNNDPKIDNLIEKLEADTTGARAEANKFKTTTRTIAQITSVVTTLKGITGRLLSLVL